MGHTSSHVFAALVAAVIVLQVIRYASRRARGERSTDAASTETKRIH
jgi:hypothetical protein